MLQMRTSFELFAATVGDVRLVNISDGAAIAGFGPVRPRDYAAHVKGGPTSNGPTWMRYSAGSRVVTAQTVWILPDWLNSAV